MCFADDSTFAARRLVPTDLILDPHKFLPWAGEPQTNTSSLPHPVFWFPCIFSSATTSVERPRRRDSGGDTQKKTRTFLNFFHHASRRPSEPTGTKRPFGRKIIFPFFLPVPFLSSNPLRLLSNATTEPPGRVRCCRRH